MITITRLHQRKILLGQCQEMVVYYGVVRGTVTSTTVAEHFVASTTHTTAVTVLGSVVSYQYRNY
jgi:hypothetical protein